MTNPIIKIVPMPGVPGATGPRGEVGPKGDPGDNGLSGASAYQIALGNGFNGTEEQWLASLVGPQGSQGTPGSNGGVGMTGASAYQVALSNGFTGSESEWLASLQGLDADLSGDLIPTQDNQFVLGNSTYRWKSISLGEGTIYVTDSVNGQEAAITVADGVFFIDGVAQAQLPNLEVTNLSFADNSVQTTAAIPQVNSDWNATSGAAEILNKPDISGNPIKGTWTPVWAGTGLVYGANTVSGHYTLIGDLVHFRIKFTLTNVQSFGTGAYTVTLPFAPAADYIFRNGGLHSSGNHYNVYMDADANSTTADLMYGAGNQEYDMDHNSPKALTTSDFFYISGTYERAV